MTQQVMTCNAVKMMVVITTAIIALLAQLDGAGAQSQYCRFTRQHTLCKHSGLGPKCGDRIPQRGISAQDAAIITAQHNQLRAKVALGQESLGAPGPQPPAANMRVLEWDNELAVVAQSHADQCIFDHECGDCRKVGRFGVGQNLFISFQSNFDTKIEWPRAIQAWYDEVSLFSRHSIKPFQFSSAIGHYTQMLWWETRTIGCGFTMFQDGGWWKKLYTCDYGPGGNVIFTEMYRQGNPCSACPAGTACSLTYPGLCESTKSIADGTNATVRTIDATATATTTTASASLPGTTTTTTSPPIFIIDNNDNEEDNNIPLIPIDISDLQGSTNTINTNNDLVTNDNNNDVDVISGLISTNNNINLETLINFFNNRRHNQGNQRNVFTNIFTNRPFFSEDLRESTTSPTTIPPIITTYAPPLTTSPTLTTTLTSTPTPTITTTTPLTTLPTTTLPQSTTRFIEPITHRGTFSVIAENLLSDRLLTQLSINQLPPSTILLNNSLSDDGITLTVLNITAMPLTTRSPVQITTNVTNQTEFSISTNDIFHDFLPENLTQAPIGGDTTVTNNQLTTNQIGFNRPQQQIFRPRPQIPTVVSQPLPGFGQPVFNLFNPFNNFDQEHEQEQQEFEQEQQEQQEFEQQEQQELEHNNFIPMSGVIPHVNDILPFLQRKGFRTHAQVIRTNSLASVQAIINTLPTGTQPLVLFRSGTGQLTELNSRTLNPLRRFGRSTTPKGRVRQQALSPVPTQEVLLTCDLDTQPCEVKTFGGNWTMADSDEVGRHMTTTLESGAGSQVVLKRLVEAPSTGVVCISFTHRRDIDLVTSTNTTSNTIPTVPFMPDLQVGVWPLGREVVQERVAGALGIWQRSSIVLAPIKTPFLIVLSVGPNMGDHPAIVSFDALTVTDGIC